jgi:hypothetical protein
VKLPPGVPRQLAIACLFLIGVFCWVVCLILLMEVTRQLLDTMRFIIEIAHMG